MIKGLWYKVPHYIKHFDISCDAPRIEGRPFNLRSPDCVVFVGRSIVCIVAGVVESERWYRWHGLNISSIGFGRKLLREDKGSWLGIRCTYGLFNT